MVFGARGCIPSVVQAIDLATLQTKIQESFAAQLLATPVSQLIELVLAGGGAGQLFQATIYYSTLEDGNWPNLADQNVRVFGASDPSTMLAKIQAFYDETDVDRTTFVEKAAGGAGAYWVDVIVYTLEEGSILAAMRDVDEVTARLASEGWDPDVTPTPVLPAPAESSVDLANAELKRRSRVRKRARKET